MNIFKDIGYTVDVLAATHVQAQVAGGETILSHLHKNSRCKERVLILDELSMINIATWAYLAEAACVGCIFVFLGDASQCPPIGEDLIRWKNLPQSDAIHDLTNGLHVQLRRFRRRRPTSTGFEPADFSHFAFVGSLYPQLEDDEDALLGNALRRARERYPNTGNEV